MPENPHAKKQRIDQGGFVYPSTVRIDPDVFQKVEKGITRRDLGALKIAAAMAAAVRGCGENPDSCTIASFSYQLSDALIQEGLK